MSAELTSKLRCGAAKLLLTAGLVLAAGCGPTWAESGIKFRTPEEALAQGLGAYKAGYYKMALPGLTYAAEHNLFLGQYHLARLLADNATATTDHAKAYQLFRAIVDEHASKIDVDDDERAPYVGKALTSLARYVYRGIPEIGLQPNPSRAAEFLEEAATFFREPDAQFELAKLHLKGDGVPEDRRKALHWLSTLTQEGHPGAQAFFADLLWSGKIVPRDEKRALALITLAVENAPGAERIWIEDTYQRIFCGAGQGVRQQADGLVASYRNHYGPRSGDVADRAQNDPVPTRTCGNGEALPKPQREGRAPDAQSRNAAAGAIAGPTPGGVLGVRGR